MWCKLVLNDVDMLCVIFELLESLLLRQLSDAIRCNVESCIERMAIVWQCNSFNYEVSYVPKYSHIQVTYKMNLNMFRLINCMVT